MAKQHDLLSAPFAFPAKLVIFLPATLIKKERPFSLEIVRHTGHNGHLLIAADLLPKRRNAQNLTPRYGFGAILGVSFRCERLYFDGCILYRPSFKSRWLSLPGNKKAPYCYDAFVLLGRWSKGTLFHYLLYFFFLLTTVVPMAAPPLMNNRAIHRTILLVSPVCGFLSDVPGLVGSVVSEGTTGFLAL